MGTNFAPLLADLFLYSWGRIHSKASTWEEKISCCDIQFNISIYRYDISISLWSGNQRQCTTEFQIWY
jgi:hypothetical protein